METTVPHVSGPDTHAVTQTSPNLPVACLRSFIAHRGLKPEKRMMNDLHVSTAARHQSFRCLERLEVAGPDTHAPTQTSPNSLRVCWRTSLSLIAHRGLAPATA